MKVKDLAKAVEEMVPLQLAQDWDNVGLLVGDPQAEVKNVLLTIDITRDVVEEAGRLKTDLIISYHPVIWDGLKRVIAEGPTSAVYELVRSQIAVFSIHTALDSAVGGVNDGLARIVGIRDPKPIGDYVDAGCEENYKLVVFIPVDSVSRVSNALFAAGAGSIGKYSQCSFQAEGTGTFLPMQGARPTVGKKGKLEKVPEVRFETIVPAAKLDDCLAAVKQAHPYETPAFDCLKLHNTRSRFGLGRIGKLTQPLLAEQIIGRIRKHTGAKAVGIVGKEKRLIRTAAVCAGSCGAIVNSVIDAGAELYLTGELKHHEALAAQEAHLTCICLSHTVSERFILRKLARELQEKVKAVTIKISKKDADPFVWKSL
jgi:dinuclear metal center YbgI/SA1388 family protein